ncbi:MAG: hypothetical protein M1820_002640 [Bogoriella megaspora]|nr:MAG: hypothetical protein M1820_002640 [Bogoriella megaspora]
MSDEARGWIYRPKGTREIQFRSLNGCASLELTVIRKLLERSTELEPYHVQNVPPHLLSTIWDELKKASLISFKVWTTFVSVFPKDPQYRYHYHTLKDANIPVVAVTDLLAPFASIAQDWLTVLSLVRKGVTLKDLTSIARIRNLVILHLDDGGSHPGTHARIDDRMIRDWTRQVVESSDKDRLQHLRAIRFINTTEISYLAINYLSDFPALTKVVITPSISASRTTSKTPDWLCWDSSVRLPAHFLNLDGGLKTFEATITNGIMEGESYSSSRDIAGDFIESRWLGENASDKSQPPLFCLRIGLNCESSSSFSRFINLAKSVYIRPMHSSASKTAFLESKGLARPHGILKSSRNNDQSEKEERISKARRLTKRAAINNVLKSFES